MSYFRFGNFRTDYFRDEELAIEVGTRSEYASSVRGAYNLSIPDSIGNFLCDFDFLPNITVSYTVAVSQVTGSLYRVENFIRDLKVSATPMTDYQRLYDSWCGKKYRMARLKSVDTVRTSGDGEAASFKIAFDCKPQLFLPSGDIWQSNHSGSDFTHFENPTKCLDGSRTWCCLFARPLIKFDVSAKSTGVLHIKDYLTDQQMRIEVQNDKSTEQTYYIDFETLDCYEVLQTGDKVSRNSNLTISNNIFSPLSKGNSGCYFVENVNYVGNVQVKTRFFTL